MLAADVPRARQLGNELRDRGAVRHLPPTYSLDDVYASALEAGYRIGGTNLYLEFLAGLARQELRALPNLPRARVGELLTNFLWRNMVSQRWQLSTAAICHKPCRH